MNTKQKQFVEKSSKAGESVGATIHNAAKGAGSALFTVLSSVGAFGKNIAVGLWKGK